MTVPALPAALNTNDVVNNAWVDAVRDGLEFHRDNVPSLRITADLNSGNGDAVADATTTVIEFSDGSSTFNYPPSVNVGGWAAAAGSNEEILVPEDGLYLCTLQAQWAYDPDGARSIAITDNGSIDATLRSLVPAVDSGTLNTFHAVSGIRFFSEDDRIGATVYQNSGNGIDLDVTLTAHWINSSAS